MFAVQLSKYLFVRLSAVARPTSVSVDVGSVSIPVFLIVPTPEPKIKLPPVEIVKPSLDITHLSPKTGEAS